MEQRSGAADQMARTRERARGDLFGLSTDWEMLEVLAEEVWARYRDEGTEESAREYLGMVEEVASLAVAKEARSFRRQHGERVSALAPGSPAERALVEPPSLGGESAQIERLAEGLLDYEPVPYTPQSESAGTEPTEALRPGRDEGAPTRGHTQVTLSAKRVRALGGAEGVNCYRYRCDLRLDEPTAGLEQKGRLVWQHRAIPTLNNHVRSFIDIGAPEEAPWSELVSAIDALIGLREMPTGASVHGRVVFSVGMEEAMVPKWREEVLTLLLQILEAHP